MIFYTVMIFLCMWAMPLLGMQQPAKVQKTVEFLQNVPEPFALPENVTNFAQKKIKEGNEILKKIARNPESIMLECKKNQQERKEKDVATFLAQQKAYLDQIIAVVWALFNKAVEKGQGFTGGTIVIIDPGFALYNFLFNYVCFVNPNIQPGKNPSNIIADNMYGYARRSTHFTELNDLSNFEGHYGIDIRYDEKDLQPLLPGNKQHILFGKLPHLAIPVIFIKFETYGLVLERKELIKHVEKAAQKGKKDILRSHTPSLSRREDMPLEVKKRFENLLNQLPKAEQKIVNKAISKQFNHIRTYYAQAKRLATHQEKYAPEAQKFVNYLDNHFDFVYLRRGNEVILDLRDFM